VHLEFQLVKFKMLHPERFSSNLSQCEYGYSH